MSGWSDDENETPATTSAAPSKGFGGGASAGSGCRVCGEEGHFARECPKKSSGGGNSGCRKCGQEGHMARDCELPDTCRRCGEEGHKQADCTAEEKTRTFLDKDGETREIYVPEETPDQELFQSISCGSNFSKYEDIPIDVKGENLPQPMLKFEESRLRQLVKDNIVKSKYKTPTPIQKHCIPGILEKRDILGCAQTGSGKTAAFLLPIISNLLEDGLEIDAGARCQAPQVLIITPTRELAIQISDQARKFAYGSGVKTALAYGGTSTVHQLNRIERGTNILVATPGRLLDFVEKGRVNFEKISYFVLDEADRMLDMGFGGEIAKCANHPTMPKKEERNTLLFSATFPQEVIKTASEYLRQDKIIISVGVVGAPCKDISQTFLPVDRNGKKEALLDILNDGNRDPTEKVMVFVNTKRQADFLATLLSQMKKPSTSIHGDRLQREREQALHDFKTGHRPIIVCTAVAARGLDIPSVQHVVNYDMPKDVDEYVHRVGRSGRVGNPGKATSFFDARNDSEVKDSLVRLLQEAGVELPGFLTGEGVDAFGDAGGNGGQPVAAAAASADDDEW